MDGPTATRRRKIDRCIDEDNVSRNLPARSPAELWRGASGRRELAACERACKTPSYGVNDRAGRTNLAEIIGCNYLTIIIAKTAEIMGA